MNSDRRIERSRSILYRAMFFMAAGIGGVLLIALTLLYQWQNFELRHQVSQTGFGLLDTLMENSKESINKGQRNSFQEVLNNFTKNPEVENVALYSRGGLMNYRSGLVTVGKPFAFENGKLVNPNQKFMMTLMVATSAKTGIFVTSMRRPLRENILQKARRLASLARHAITS